MASQEVDLFGEVIDDFKSAKERYGIWPMTVCPCDMSDPLTRRMKELIGDDGSAREDAKMRINKAVNPMGKTGVSIFNPAVASWILNCWAPETGVCFDPFAGGGTRAIMSAKHGLFYKGTELRQEEVNAVLKRCDNAGVRDKVMLVKDDARNAPLHFPEASADFLITCPPYYNLEEYNGGEKDLSMAPTYAQFLDGLADVVKATHHILKPGSKAVWVIGLHRFEDGSLIPMHHDLSRIHMELGFKMQEEVILNLVNNGAIQRVGNFDRGNKRLIRNHEYVLVYQR